MLQLISEASERKVGKVNIYFSHLFNRLTKELWFFLFYLKIEEGY